MSNVYNNKKSNFKELLETDGSAFTHHQNIRLKMSKVFRDRIPQIVKELFQFRDAMPYQLRKQTDFQITSYMVLSVVQKI